MAALLLAEFKSKREADLVAELIGSMRSATVLQKGKNLEDMYFAELINKGMKEKGKVSVSTFKRELKEQIARNRG